MPRQGRPESDPQRVDAALTVGDAEVEVGQGGGLESAQRQKVKGKASLAKAKESPDGKEKAKEAVRGGRKEHPAGD